MKQTYCMYIIHRGIKRWANTASLEVATSEQWLSRASAYKSGAKLEIIFELAKTCHENIRIFDVLTINSEKLTVKGVNFDTICEGIGLFGYIIYLKRE